MEYKRVFADTRTTETGLFVQVRAYTPNDPMFPVLYQIREGARQSQEENHTFTWEHQRNPMSEAIVIRYAIHLLDTFPLEED